jgi:hypothetical protein
MEVESSLGESRFEGSASCLALSPAYASSRRILRLVLTLALLDRLRSLSLGTEAPEFDSPPSKKKTRRMAGFLFSP